MKDCHEVQPSLQRSRKITVPRHLTAKYHCVLPVVYEHMPSFLENTLALLVIVAHVHDFEFSDDT